MILRVVQNFLESLLDKLGAYTRMTVRIKLSRRRRKRARRFFEAVFMKGGKFADDFASRFRKVKNILDIEKLVRSDETAINDFLRDNLAREIDDFRGRKRSRMTGGIEAVDFKIV